ncbi:MAG: protease [Saezia sp.]
MGEQDQNMMLTGGQSQDTSGQGIDHGYDQQADAWAEATDSGEDVHGAPEQYAFSMPEGAVDEGVIEAYSDVAKELNLPQHQAQKVIDRVLPAMQSQQAQMLSKAREDWAQASRLDREFGGGRLNESLSIAKKAIDTFGSPELEALLNQSGLGNHPEIIRAFYRAGKSLHQDSIVTGGKGAFSNSEPMEKKFYPNM